MSVSTENGTVVVVEDDPHIADLVDLYLRRDGYRVLLAPDGEKGLALSRQQLLDGVWGSDWYGDERTVDVHVAQLRKKLGPELPLATVWGMGYRFG